jgi:hypothetical protein
MEGIAQIKENCTREKKNFDEQYYMSPMPAAIQKGMEYYHKTGAYWHLPPRILSADEIKNLTDLSYKELLADVNEEEDINFFKDLSLLAEVCYLLTKPENYIKVSSSQQRAKQKQKRTIADMINEMAQELSNLPRFTAYAKSLQEKDGQQRVIKKKSQTIALPRMSKEANEQTGKRRKVIEENSRRYVKSRNVIEEEIRERQERWSGGGSFDEPPSPRGGTGNETRRGGPPPRSSKQPPK